MTDRPRYLKYDPIKPLMDSGNDAVAYFTRRDLLDHNAGPAGRIWGSPEVSRILTRRRTGSLAESWKSLRYLVGQYGMDRSQPAVSKAAEYALSRQTDEGDIRGMLGNQYAPYYTGAIMSLLIEAGYGADPRMEKGFRWLLDVRQDDGGWVIGSPGFLGLGKLSRAELIDLTSNPARETARQFEPSKPFSAAGTGMVLRAFAAHPQYRSSPEALKAACLLKSKLLKKDNWTSYGHPDNWVRFQFPFWWTNLVSALDTLTLMGFTAEDDDIRKGLEWLIGHQQPDGLWKVSYSGIHKNTENSKSHETRLWVTLAICRILKRCYG